MKYDFQTIEERWQSRWAAERTFRTPNPGDADFDPKKPKYYVLDMFPYPSGVGLHVGHPLGYIATDIVARYKRMRGFNVLHPMGYDAFGLPAEQFAVEHGVHPRITTEQNIANMTRQLKRLGLSYDWDRCVATIEPRYYRWTQWIFLQLYHSWFDPESRGARPIAELVRALEAERYYVTPDGALVASEARGLDAIGGTPGGVRKWFELTPPQQERLLDQYRLAYLDEVAVNWCPALGTVLANEEVTPEGKSDRGNHPVFRRPLRQWMLRITAYGDRLIEDLDLVDWPESVKMLQRNWIGRSHGAEVNFALEQPESDEQQEVITVFTTRPDTLFGATYMVLAPEHPLALAITTPQQQPAVQAYRDAAARKTDIDRQADTKLKTGVFTGAYAINPVNDERIPIWLADYVLMGYGTGAIMAVPAHDTRDFAFARTFDLPIRTVVMASDDWLEAQQQENPDLAGKSLEDLRELYIADPSAFTEAYTGAGRNINSANEGVSLDDLTTEEAKSTIGAWLTQAGLGRTTVQYKLRDWLFSRQRYWGEPFPILHGPEGQTVAVDERELPVLLPEMEDFTPHASDDPNAAVQTPLSRAPEGWKHVERGGMTFTRELNTMPQWAGSCWYYLRFLDAQNDDRFASREAEKYWMVSPKRSGGTHSGGVDLYVGGVEHAVLHLLYARFWHKVLYDLGHVSTPEPFGRLFNQGYIQAFAYTDERGLYVEASEVEHRPGAAAELTRQELKGGKLEPVTHKTEYFYRGRPVVQEYGKMGKSLKNAVSPDDMCQQYGCDTLRLYEMYLGPLDASKQWSTRDIVGVHRFLQRLWRNFIREDGSVRVSNEAADLPTRKLLHRTIGKVTADMERMTFNTAIAALIELNNELVGRETLPREVAEAMVLLIAPLAPHMAEELWQRLGHMESLAYAGWPAVDPEMLAEEAFEYPVQINGKVRGKVSIATDADDKAIEQAVLADGRIQAALGGQTVRKVIVIPKRMVNIVAK